MKPEKNQFINLGFLFFILFLIFSFFTYLQLFLALDYKTTVFLQKIIPDFFITPFSTFSILGTAEITGIILLILLFLFVKYKKIYILVLFILLGVIEIFGKTVIPQIPPPEHFLKTNLHLGLPAGGVAHHFFAYPSGHTARTAFISGFLLLVIWLSPKISKELKILISIGVIIFDIVMFLSRVYLGEHWASDVIGGMLLGFSLAFFTSYFLYLKTSK